MKALQGFGGGSGEVLIENVGCSGSELTLSDCVQSEIGDHNCGSDHDEDAGVICISGSALLSSLCVLFYLKSYCILLY